MAAPVIINTHRHHPTSSGRSESASPFPPPNRRRRSSRGMLDSLIDREDREIACSGETAGVEEALQTAERHCRAVGLDEDAIDEVGSRQVERLLGDLRAGVAQQGFRFRAEQFDDSVVGLCHWGVPMC